MQKVLPKVSHVKSLSEINNNSQRIHNYFRKVANFAQKTANMNKDGAIVIIEDDIDDQEIFSEVLKELNFSNELIFFSDGKEGLKYLTETDQEPFIVFSDINMPKLSGMELREKIHENENIRVKTIPYLFFTTSAEQEHVIEAYSKSIQGFFIKPANYDDLKTLMRKIIEYWKECVSPDFVL